MSLPVLATVPAWAAQSWAAQPWAVIWSLLAVAVVLTAVGVVVLLRR